jgi:hypothetical protein
MTKAIPDWMIQVAWFAAGICATGAFWYFLSQKEHTWTIVAAVGALGFASLAICLHMRKDGPAQRHRYTEQMAAFLTEAQQLRARLDDTPLPIQAHNEWVERVGMYLRENLGQAYEMRFGDFSGMIFYGNGSERSTLSRSLEGRSRRLHEFMSELGP